MKTGKRATQTRLKRKAKRMTRSRWKFDGLINEEFKVDLVQFTGDGKPVQELRGVERCFLKSPLPDSLMGLPYLDLLMMPQRGACQKNPRDRGLLHLPQVDFA